MAYVPVPKDLSKVKTKVALNLNKKTDHLLLSCGSVRSTSLLFNKKQSGNRCGSYAYGHCDAAIFLSGNV